jgi:hypothetical protein
MGKNNFFSSFKIKLKIQFLSESRSVKRLFRSSFDVKDIAYGVHSYYQNLMLISKKNSVFYADA